tara:strand:+ start:272 stop:820 length:549 start_codon:yes stop_codon:yes gene_type:complete
MKTVCTSSVIAHFGIPPSTYHYSGSIPDIKRILQRGGFSVRSRKSACKLTYRAEQANGKMKTLRRLHADLPSVAKIRPLLRKLNDAADARYLVLVPGHVLLLDGNGKTIVDTDDRKVDRRKVQGVWVVEGYQAKADQQFKWDRDHDLSIGVPEKWAGVKLVDIPADELDDFIAWVHEKRPQK